MKIDELRKLTRLEQGEYFECMLRQRDFINAPSRKQREKVKGEVETLRKFGYKDDMTAKEQQKVVEKILYFEDKVLECIHNIPFDPAINEAIIAYLNVKMNDIEKQVGILPYSIEDNGVMLFGDIPTVVVDGSIPEEEFLSAEEIDRMFRDEQDGEEDTFLSDDLDLDVELPGLSDLEELHHDSVEIDDIFKVEI